jgi:type 1 glutamine amidotransferase/cytochrome c2
MIRPRRTFIAVLVVLAVCVGTIAALHGDSPAPARKKIVLIAGKKSHGPVGNGVHDYGWSVRLLKVMLENSNIKDRVRVEAHLDGWPKGPATLEDADTVMIVSDGRDGDKFEEAPHLASEERVRFIDKQIKRGCGFVTFHFSTFAPEAYRDKVLDWNGGYFQWETDGKRQWYSAIKTIEDEVQLGTPDHAVARGVKPFKLREEFYYNLRFKPKNESFRPILVVPALKGREPDGNIVAWAHERDNGGRGFGTSCGHFYDNWKNDAFRKLMLNAIAWTAKVDVPEGGVESRFYSHDEIDKVLGAYPAEPKPEDKKPADARPVDPKSIRVLLLAGNEKHKWHNWEKTTPVIKTFLERDLRIKVDVTTDIEDLARKKLGDYQVIVQNYVNWEDPNGVSEAARKAFTQFMADGGGLVVVHFADGAFHYSLPGAKGFDWPEYRKMVRRVWNHEEKDGRPKSAHDAFGKFTVRITDTKSPLTDGLAAFDVNDELYFRQDGDEAIEPLIAAESKITKKMEPLAWTSTYGKGRVFQTLLGHSEKTYDAYEAREILRRAVAWAAGQEIIKLDAKKEAALAPFPDKRNHWGPDQVGFRWVEEDSRDDRWKDSQIGRFLASALPLPLGCGVVSKGLSIRVGDHQEASICYDTEHLTVRSAWAGNFLQFNPARFGIISPPVMAGKPLFLTGPADGWPRADVHYGGLHINGHRIVLTSTVRPIVDGKPGEAVAVRESPWLVAHDGLTAFTRTVEVGPSATPLTMQIATGAKVALQKEGNVELATVKLGEGDTVLTSAIALVGDSLKLAADNGTVALSIPAHKEPLRFTLLMTETDTPKLAALLGSEEVKRVAAFDFTKGSAPGPAHWTAEITTKGSLGTEPGPYVIDTFTMPFDNPYKALLFVTGHDFFANGDVALCTVHGDVWRVSGVDDKLTKLTWKRYSTGLFQPLGLKIVDDKVYVLGRDQITRLHDLNGDGEADFYENFCNLAKTSPAGHDFSTCLETDAAGNFYFLAARDGLMRVSRDGSKIESLATGFRNPNGMAIGPGDVMTVSPQEGDWTPASNITEVRQGGYYGFGGPHVAPDRPLGYDPPLCWIPRRQDNSSGGQTWVDSDRWGPLRGQMLHLSYGQCRVMLVVREKLGPDVLGGSAIAQGGVVDFPNFFSSGITRGRFSPHDGQLYVTGLKGWTSAATQDGCLQRLRYTGKPVDLPVRCRTMKNGLAITFTRPLDKETAEDPDSYQLEQWNYHYSATYGSPDFKVSNPKQEGHDEVEVASATLLDPQTVFLEIPNLKPVMQLSVRYALKARDGAEVRQALNYTIHAVGTEAMDATKLVRKARPGQLKPAEEAALRPGLLARFQQEDAKDVRDTRLAALSVAEGTAVSSFLRPGPFRATLEGYVRVPLRGDYTFSLRGHGEVVLRIDGKEALHGSGDLSAIPSTKIALHKGYNAIALEYTAPTKGDAALRLLWQGDDFPLESVPPTALFHRGDDTALTATDRLHRGRELFAERHCFRCHGTAERSAMPGLDATGPNLAEVGGRLQPEWMMQWLLDPRATQNHATMPKLFTGDEAGKQKAADVVAFLTSLKAKEEKPAAGEKGQVAAGRNLFEDLNCVVCHRLTPPAAADEYDRTSLHFAGAKYRPAALAAFLRKPHEHAPWSRMPDFHLNEEELASLTAFLQAEAKGKIAPQPELARGDAKRGRELFASLRCVNCHKAGNDDPPAGKPIALKPRAEGGCLKAETGPDFSLTTAECAALTAFLAADGQSLNRRVPAEESRWLARDLRCTACHSRDSAISPHWSIVADEGRGILPDALPLLTWSGEKLRADWTERLLSGKLGYRVRPQLRTRMPSFPAYADALALGLAAEHGIPRVEEPATVSNKELAAIGNQLTQKTALDCRQCHAVGREAIQGDDRTKIAVGINFAQVRERLRPEFFTRFVLDPPRYDPPTKMPKFIADLKTTKVTNVFDGDAHRQLEAIWMFIRSVPMEEGSGPAPKTPLRDP